MQYTSAQANKLLKKLQEDHGNLLAQESMSRTFVAATIEDPEEARPTYSYAETQRQLEELEGQIRHVKHCINTFNLTHEVEGFGMTVDQMLVYIPQLSSRKAKLGAMAMTLEKNRLGGSARANIIEYEYANYDVAQAAADYAAVSDELARAQLALDRLNNAETMEIEL